MRGAYAMPADGGHSEAANQAAWFAPALAFVSASLGAVLLYLGQRLIGKAAWQDVVNKGFQGLLERTEALHAAERTRWEAERLQLRGEIVNLRQSVASLMTILRKRGVVDIPEARFGDDPMIQLPAPDEEQ